MTPSLLRHSVVLVKHDQANGLVFVKISAIALKLVSKFSQNKFGSSFQFSVINSKIVKTRSCAMQL